MNLEMTVFDLKMKKNLKLGRRQIVLCRLSQELQHKGGREPCKQFIRESNIEITSAVTFMNPVLAVFDTTMGLIEIDYSRK